MFRFALSDRAGYRNYHRLEDDPENAIQMLFPDSAPAILADPDAVDLTVRLMKTSFPMSLGKVGTLNDLSETNFFPENELQNVSVPTLILHSASDEMAPIGRIDPAIQKIPGVETVIFETGGHLFFVPHRERFVREIVGFLEANAIIPR